MTEICPLIKMKGQKRTNSGEIANGQNWSFRLQRKLLGEWRLSVCADDIRHQCSIWATKNMDRASTRKSIGDCRMKASRGRGPMRLLWKSAGSLQVAHVPAAKRSSSASYSGTIIDPRPSSRYKGGGEATGVFSPPLAFPRRCAEEAGWV